MASSEKEAAPAPGVVNEELYCSTCRPCCTIPHGKWSLATAIIASVSWIFALMAMSSCHYMEAEFQWCKEPKPVYGTCGDCFCARGNEPCPTGVDVPQTEFHVEVVEEWKAMKPIDPMNITCNPYLNETCDATPPVQMKELWEDAVCAIQYDYENNLSNDEFQCPTQYESITYESKEAAEAAGAYVTHWGSCGVCSTLQDLAVYVEYPDLTAEGQECGIRGLIDLRDGIQCFQDIGYTLPCATMWMHNVFNTRDFCQDICIDFTFDGDPNNGPPPTCKIATCLQCDEDYSGPFFKTYAGRARRRSGLLSKIARPCDAILIVNHSDPCPARLPPEQERTSLIESTKKDPECLDIKDDLGPLFYADTETNLFFDIEFLLSRNTRLTRSLYDSCSRYEFNRVVAGFWYDMKPRMKQQQSSGALAILATVLGGIATFLCWTTTCAAFRRNFWLAMAISFLLCGIFNFLTLIIFKADICPPGGCKWKKGATHACVAGALWFVSSLIAFMTFKLGGHARPDRTVGCCCCPHSEYGVTSEQMAPLIGGASGLTTNVTTTESMQEDGTKVTKKVITNPDGSRTVETITSSKEVGSGSSEESEIDNKVPDEAE